MVAVRLVPDIRHVAIAAPSYLASFGVLKTPKELPQHKCLRWRWAGETNPYVWEFFESDAWFNVEVSGSHGLRHATPGHGRSGGHRALRRHPGAHSA